MIAVQVARKGGIDDLRIGVVNEVGYPIIQFIPRHCVKLNGWELQGRAFAAKMLPPHQSAHGFFYFNTAHFRASQLYITGIREAATGKELFYYEIPLAKTAP